MTKRSLEDIVTDEKEFKKERRTFDKAHWVGTAGSYIGSALGTYLTHKITRNPLLAAGLGSTIGDYVGYEAGFTPYWYSKHKDRYKGIRGKGRMFKDWASFNIKALPLDLASYAVVAPLAIGATYLTGNPVLGAMLGNAATDVGYWLGLRWLNKKKLGKIAEEKPKYSNPVENYGPAMPYKQAA
ncbi:hypothetical protein HYT54_04500 [Candidatus Woesearchaeota archaeon]|nr:hypothetical protein [Candidatus Woesearchaeota archaeon]